MKIRIGIQRARFTPKDGGTLLDGKVQMIQNSDDVLEIELADDGTETIARIWMVTDEGHMIYNEPLALFPVSMVIQELATAAAYDPTDPDEFDPDDEDQADEADDLPYAHGTYKRCQVPSAHAPSHGNVCNVIEHHHTPLIDDDEVAELADMAAEKQFKRDGLIWPNSPVHGDTR